MGQTFGTLDGRIRSVPRRVHELELWLLIADPLTHIVDPFDTDPEPLTAGLPVVPGTGTPGRVYIFRILFRLLEVYPSGSAVQF